MSQQANDALNRAPWPTGNQPEPEHDESSAAVTEL